MQSKAVKSGTLALLLCGASISAAQQTGPPQGGVRPEAPASPGAPRPPKQKAPPEKSKLEEMLAEALRNNPDIRVASAKLAEAEAKLNRARVQVTQQVVTLHQAILAQKAVVDFTQKKLERLNALLASRAIDNKLVEEESANLLAAKAKLAQLEAQLTALLGRSVHPEDDSRAVRTAARLALGLTGQQPDPNALELYRLALAAVVANPHKATGPMADRLRKALQTPIQVDYKDMTLDAILKDLAKKVEGLSFRIRNYSGKKINLRFEETLPVSTILQALSDETRNLFFVREYGILVTVKEDVPPGAMTVEEFLRQKPENDHHKEVRHFIESVWPTLDLSRLEESISEAREAFKTCKRLRDLVTMQKLLRGSLAHADRLEKKLAELHPELVIDDEKEALQLKRVHEQIVKLGTEIRDYLNAHSQEK